MLCPYAARTIIAFSSVSVQHKFLKALLRSFLDTRLNLLERAKILGIVETFNVAHLMVEALCERNLS